MPLVTIKGIEGVFSPEQKREVIERVTDIRARTHLPVGVGFGIRDAQTAKAIGRVADAVVIGSRLIQLIENESADKVNAVAGEFLSGIRQALDA